MAKAEQPAWQRHLVEQVAGDDFPRGSAGRPLARARHPSADPKAQAKTSGSSSPATASMIVLVSAVMRDSAPRSRPTRLTPRPSRATRRRPCGRSPSWCRARPRWRTGSCRRPRARRWSRRGRWGPSSPGLSRSAGGRDSSSRSLWLSKYGFWIPFARDLNRCMPNTTWSSARTPWTNAAESGTAAQAPIAVRRGTQSQHAGSSNG